jgi:tetratricopeptide (TPR) repeat protein
MASAQLKPSSSNLEHWRRLSVVFPATATVTCKTQPNDVTNRLTIRGVNAKQAARLLGVYRTGRYTLRVWREYKGKLLGVLFATRGRVRCSIARHAGGLTVYAGVIARADRMKQLRAFIDLPLASPDVRSFVAPIEKLIKRKKYAAAIRAFETLDIKPGLRAYVRLRAADIQFFLGRLPTAHMQYVSISRRSGWTAAGFPAALRRAYMDFALEAREPKAQIIGALRDLSHVQADRGRYMISLLLIESGRLEDAMTVLSRATKKKNKALRQRVLALALRKAIWRGDYFRAGVLCLREDKALRTHREFARMQLLCGRSFAGIGLPQDAIGFLQRALKATKGKSSEREWTMAALVSAYYDAGRFFRAVRAAEYYLTLFGRSHRAQSVRDLLASGRISMGEVDMIRPKAIKRLSADVRKRVERALAVARGQHVKGPLFKKLQRLFERQVLLVEMIRRRLEKQRKAERRKARRRNRGKKRRRGGTR